MDTHPNTRPSEGWYERGDGNGLTLPIVRGRLTFWEKVNQHAPEVAVALRDEVFPVLVQEEPLLRCDGFLLPHVWTAPARAAFEAFVRRFHLADPWAQEVVAWTVRRWAAFRPDPPPAFSLDALQETLWELDCYSRFLCVQATPDDTPVGPWRVPVWLMSEPWRDYEETTLASLRKWLQAYRHHCEVKAVAADWRQPPQKRARGSHDSVEHFVWLVRFHVQGWKHAHIADEYSVDFKTVAAACRSTAKLIGLARRTDRLYRTTK